MKISYDRKEKHMVLTVSGVDFVKSNISERAMLYILLFMQDTNKQLNTMGHTVALNLGDFVIVKEYYEEGTWMKILPVVNKFFVQEEEIPEDFKADCVKLAKELQNCKYESPKDNILSVKKIGSKYEIEDLKMFNDEKLKISACSVNDYLISVYTTVQDTLNYCTVDSSELYTVIYLDFGEYYTVGKSMSGYHNDYFLGFQYSYCKDYVTVKKDGQGIVFKLSLSNGKIYIDECLYRYSYSTKTAEGSYTVRNQDKNCAVICMAIGIAISLLLAMCTLGEIDPKEYKALHSIFGILSDDVNAALDKLSNC